MERLHFAPGLYRFTDLALEYQITRPGPARAKLCSALDPLDKHPELMETLRRHVANNSNRQQTARMLNIHTYTVDYRLRKIGQLAGHDATTQGGMWQLRSALVARIYRHVDVESVPGTEYPSTSSSWRAG